MQYSSCTVKIVRNEGDNDTINSNDMGCDDENKINNEESMDDSITDDCDDNESETSKEEKDDEDSFTTKSDMDDNNEYIEKQMSEEDDIPFDDTVLFPESNLTIRDIMIIVVTFSLRI
ncbi:pheromone-processing carboxypeptidase KEX1-like [Monomorium pharaonis]|uniref:pheromone-processing carboxypeptidase KEX1-like n=1 Tax=Monomorium pharaonis TaxID=307658 RepID=UPI00102E1533|nr:pheromone-processing carboxypeptidase KEX1-like [Monomorium pharaonis]